MNITVKLFATFRTGRFAKESRDYQAGTSVSDIVKELEIDGEEIGALLINGRHVEEDALLQDGDTLSIFPLVGGG